MSERKQKSQKSPNIEQLTAGTTIRIEQPKSKRQGKAKVTVAVVKDINPVTGFANFIRHYGVIAVAVGFAIASQAQLLIKSLIDNLISPMYALIFGTGDPAKQVATLHFSNRAQPFKWGLVITQLVNFLFILAVIYAIVKILNLNKLDKEE